MALSEGYAKGDLLLMPVFMPEEFSQVFAPEDWRPVVDSSGMIWQKQHNLGVMVAYWKVASGDEPETIELQAVDDEGEPTPLMAQVQIYEDAQNEGWNVPVAYDSDITVFEELPESSNLYGEGNYGSGTYGEDLGYTPIPTTVEITESGVFEVPDGVTQIQVECVGNGGDSPKHGAGGGGGAYASSILLVSPEDTFDVNFNGDVSFGDNDVVAASGEDATLGMFDDFDRILTGGWGGEWLNVASGSRLSANGTRGFVTMDGGNTAHNAQIAINRQIPADFDVTYDVLLPPYTPATVANMIFDVRCRVQNNTASECYQVRMGLTQHNNVTVDLRHTPSSPVTLGSFAGVGSTNARVKLRIQMIGTQLRVKQWLQSSTEPVGWGISVTDSTYTTAGLDTSGSNRNNRILFLHPSNAAPSAPGPYTWRVDNIHYRSLPGAGGSIDNSVGSVRRSGGAGGGQGTDQRPVIPRDFAPGGGGAGRAIANGTAGSNSTVTSHGEGGTPSGGDGDNNGIVPGGGAGGNTGTPTTGGHGRIFVTYEAVPFLINVHSQDELKLRGGDLLSFVNIYPSVTASSIVNSPSFQNGAMVDPAIDTEQVNYQFNSSLGLGWHSAVSAVTSGAAEKSVVQQYFTPLFIEPLSVFFMVRPLAGDQLVVPHEHAVLNAQKIGGDAAEGVYFREGVNQWLEDNESWTSEEGSVPLIEGLTIEFNESLTSPGYVINMEGLLEFNAITVYRRDTQGVRYEDKLVRGLTRQVTSDNKIVAVDYEAPLNSEVGYMFDLEKSGGRFFFGPYYPTPPFIPTLYNAYAGGTAFIKPIDLPDLGQPIGIEHLDDWSRPARIRAEHEILGRRNKVIISDVRGGREGSMSGHCIMTMGQTVEDFERAFGPGVTMLIQNHNPTVSSFPDMYVQIGDISFHRHTKMVKYGEMDNHNHVQDVVVTFEFSYTEVDMPDPTGVVLFEANWGTVNNNFSSWREMWSYRPTWRDVLSKAQEPVEEESD